jgi:hypothetical protein
LASHTTVLKVRYSQLPFVSCFSPVKKQATELNWALRKNLQDSAKKEIQQDNFVEVPVEDLAANLTLEPTEKKSGRLEQHSRRKFAKLNEQYSQQAYQQLASKNANDDSRTPTASRRRSATKY